MMVSVEEALDIGGITDTFPPATAVPGRQARRPCEPLAARRGGPIAWCAFARGAAAFACKDDGVMRRAAQGARATPRISLAGLGKPDRER